MSDDAPLRSEIHHASQWTKAFTGPRVRSPRLVIKVGSSLLANEETLTPCFDFMHALMNDIKRLQGRGYEVILASSGSVALGLKALGLTPEKAGIQDKQAAAAVGQPLLLNVYRQMATESGLTIAQVLVTLDDLEAQRRFLNTKNTVHRLLQNGVVPIVNENDTVTTEELRVGDNDRLAARFAQMVQADQLVILTSVDGLYDRDPSDVGATFIDEVDDVAEYLDVAQGTSSLGSGGMLTKMQAANMAQNAGCATLIARGEGDRPITSVIDGEKRSTLCRADRTPSSWWDVWLTDRLQMAGSVVISQAVADALEGARQGIALADIRSLHSDFAKADVIHIYDEAGVERARGMASFSSEEARILARNPEVDTRELLGYTVARELVSVENLVLLEDHHLPWDEPESAPSVVKLAG